MGQLQGKAAYLKATTPFLNASERDVNKLWECFNDVAEGFGLNQDELVEICRSMQPTLEIHARNEMDQLSTGLFTALDTDENGLVDALEFLGTMAMMSAMPIPQKLTFLYNCYDFNETGQLSLDELTLAFKSTLTGLCKLCAAVSCPTELVLEDLAQHAFQRSQKPGVDDFLTLPEFLRFTETTPEVTSWVDYFDCPHEFVDEQDGDDSDAEREAVVSLLAPSAQDDESIARKRDASLPYDSAAPDLTTNKVLPRRPWQLAVGNTAPSAPPMIDPRMPAASLELEWIYGYNSDIRGVVHYISPAEAIYPAGSVVIVYDIVAHRQRFACHHAGLIQALAVHPSDRSVIATSEAALKPKIVIWTTQGLSESGAGGGGGVLSVLRGFHRNGVSHLAWMPNGRTLVTIGQDEFHCVAVYQWEKATASTDGNVNSDAADWSKPGELIFAGRGGREPVHGLAVLNGPSGQSQFVTGGRRHLFFWARERDARYSSPHALFSRLPGVLGRKAKVQTIMTVAALPADSQGSGAIAGTARGQILLFEGRNCVRVLYAHAAAVTALFAFTGGVLSGGKDGKVRVWSRRLEPGAQFDLVALGSSAPRVRSLVSSPDGGAKLLVATAGAEIYEIASSDGANLHFGPVPKLVNPNKQGAFAVLNETSLTVKFEAKDSKRSIRTLRFSGDGLTLAVGSNDNCIYSYHTEDWASKGKCRARDAGVVLNTFDFSTTGEYIMANSQNRGELVFFESSSGVEVTRVATLKDVEWLSCSCPFGWGVQGAWPIHKANSYELSVVDRSLGPETPMLVTGDTLGSLRLFRYPCVNPESLCQVARGAASTISAVRFTADGSHVVATARDERCIFQWRIEREEIDVDGGVSGSEDGADVPTTSDDEREEPAAKSVPTVAVSEDQINPAEAPVTPIVVVTVGVKSAAFWRLAAGQTLVKKDALVGRKGRQGGTPPSFLSVVCCGKDAIAGTVSGDLYRFKGVELISIVPAHSRGVAALYSSTAASGGIASGGQDGLVKLWSADLECLAEFGEFNASARHAIRSVYWDETRDTLLVGTRGSTIHLLSSLDGTLQALKTPDGTPVTSLEGHARGELHGLSVCYTKARGCTTGDDGVLRIWDLAHHLLVVSTKLETSSRACAYSPDGDFIAVGLGSGGTGRRHKKDGSMLVFEDRGQSVELVYETRDTKQSVTVLRFSPDGQSLVCGALDGSVYIYDVPSNYTKRAVFSKHKAPITHLDLASDSQYVRSNCRGFELLFADVTTGSHVASATALRNQIWDTCNTIYNWSNQGIWPVAPPGLGDAATREITCCACSMPGSSYQRSNAILAAGNSHGAINIFKFPSFVQGSGAKTYYGHSGAVAQLGFSGAGGALCLSIGRSDRCMLQWRRLYGVASEGDGTVNGNASVAKDLEDDPDLEVEGRFLPEAFVNDGGGTQNEVKPYVSAILPPSGNMQEPGEVDGVARQCTFELEHVFGFRAHDVRQNAVYTRPKRVVFPTGCLGVSYDRREHRQQFYTGHIRPIFCLAASPCGAFVASGEICAQTFAHERPRIHVWEPDTCTRVAELSAFHRKAVTSLAFSMPDGKLLAAVGQDEFHSLAVYRSVSGQWFDGALIANSRSTRHPVLFVCFIEEPQASGGCRLVSGGDNHVLFWKLTPPALTAREGVFGARAQRQPVLCGASMGSLVVTGCASGHIYLWEACVVGRVIPAHSGSVYAIHATTLGCATGGRDGHVKLWARTTFAPLADFDVSGCQPAPHNAAVRSLCWDVAEDRLLLGTKGTELLELSRLTGDTILVTESHFDHTAQLQGLSAHPLRPGLVATAGGDHTVRVWHLEKRCAIAKTTLDGALRSVAYSPDGKWLAVGFGGSSETSKNSHKDGAFAVLDAQTLELLHEGRDSKLSALDMTFSPDLTLLALASADNCLYIYSALDNFSLRFKFSKASGRATRVDFAADSSMARMSSDAFELLFVSTMDGSHITSPASAADTVWASHKCLFAWAAQGVWDVAGRPDDRVRALAKANTQQMLVAATNQGELRVYNTPCISRHAEQHTLHGHSLDVANVVFTCDDSRLVSIGANDKSLLIWRVNKR
ncbi:hypothetical protein JM16_007566 [Phytophthora kernoviae]|uniref:EF-hand domain-containing protein n=1 Tax=Phytophthora kernoviae TaxID=325452 RepID=A0A8T0LP46_9STRA|nr:hypothetical protein JM16_007566 [Phytophthora kernoviae]